MLRTSYRRVNHDGGSVAGGVNESRESKAYYDSQHRGDSSLSPLSKRSSNSHSRSKDKRRGGLRSSFKNRQTAVLNMS